MRQPSAKTHEFQRKTVPPDGKCLFWSFLAGTMPLLKRQFGDLVFDDGFMRLFNEDLRVRVANYIRNHPENHENILTASEYETIEEYCSDIEEVKLWAGAVELEALANMYDIIIYVVNPKQINKDNEMVLMQYGEGNQSATECIYMYYNGTTHYDALCVVDKENKNEIETMFDPNDRMVKHLLEKYVQDVLKHTGGVKSNFQIGTRIEEIHPMEDLSKIEADMQNKPTKRKQSELDLVPISSKNDKPLPILIPEQFYDPNKRVKCAAVADQSPTFSENNAEKMDMNKPVQVGVVSSESCAEVDQNQTTGLSMALNAKSQEKNPEVEKERDDKPGDSIQDDDQLKYNSQSLS